MELETRAVLKEVILARDALARLDASAASLPNPTVLINAIPLLEAQASSEIENIVTTTDELFSASAHPDDAADSAAAREALRYRTALRRGFADIASRPLTARTAIEVCSILRGHDVAVRTGEVYIGDPATRRRTYTPPDNKDDVDRCLDNWTMFVNAVDDLDPLVRIAVAHYQFEAIHPFSDGNGRTGRIVNVLMLCTAGLLRLPLVYPSRSIIETKDEYYRLLLAVTSCGAWEEWILYMLRVLRDATARTLKLVERVREVEDRLTAVVRAVLGSADHDVVMVLMEQPYARTRDVVSRCGVTRQTAARWLKGLVESGVLREVRVGRETLYINEPFMDVLRRA